MFQKNTPPLSSGSKHRPCKKPAQADSKPSLLLLLSCLAYSIPLKMETIYSSKCQTLSELYGITTQKIVIIILNFLELDLLCQNVFMFLSFYYSSLQADIVQTCKWPIFKGNFTTSVINLFYNENIWENPGNRSLGRWSNRVMEKTRLIIQFAYSTTRVINKRIWWNM